MALRLTLLALFLGCTAPPTGGSSVPFDQVTLQSLVRWPDGREYVTVSGVGYPADGQKAVEDRRKTAREGAVLAAEQRMIVELERMVPRERVRDLLKQSQVADLKYAYDDICTATLRLPKDAVSGKPESPW